MANSASISSTTTGTTTYIADAVALARYIEDTLPPKADHIFSEAERGRAEILVPEIAIGELMYTALKGRLKKEDKISDIRASLGEILDEIESSSYLRQVQMTPAAWRCFLASNVRELHDRMIHAIAVSLAQASSSQVTIITNDPELAASFRTVW
jgi:predicted nucleic acid-binding protein